MDSIIVVKENETSPPVFVIQLVFSEEAVGRFPGKEGFVYRIMIGVRAVWGPGERIPLCNPVNKPNQPHYTTTPMANPSSQSPHKGMDQVITTGLSRLAPS
jgi:hypothetical protein